MHGRRQNTAVQLRAGHDTRIASQTRHVFPARGSESPSRRQGAQVPTKLAGASPPRPSYPRNYSTRTDPLLPCRRATSRANSPSASEIHRATYMGRVTHPGGRMSSQAGARKHDCARGASWHGDWTRDLRDMHASFRGRGPGSTRREEGKGGDVWGDSSGGSSHMIRLPNSDSRVVGFRWHGGAERYGVR